jgi:predicted transcriptional regulator
MVQTLVELTKDLTLALVQTGNVSAEYMQETLEKTYATLASLKAQDESDPSAPEPASKAAAMDWRKSITKHVITCLECGLAMKQLSIRHLRMHELDGRSYRAKYGIPRTQPLSARSTTDRRRQVVRQTRPWEKAPTYRKGQTQHGHRTPEPEAETVPEETRASSAEAPAQPKQQRKTTPKKKTARKRSSHG